MNAVEERVMVDGLEARLAVMESEVAGVKARHQEIRSDIGNLFSKIHDLGMTLTDMLRDHIDADAAQQRRMLLVVIANLILVGATVLGVVLARLLGHVIG